MRLHDQHYNTLKVLNNKASSLNDMTQGSSSMKTIHLERWLNEMQRGGYVVFIDPLWHITNGGRQALASKYDKDTEMLNRMGKVRVYDLETYVPNNKQVYRPGSLDFLACPSNTFAGITYPQTGLSKLV